MCTDESHNIVLNIRCCLQSTHLWRSVTILHGSRYSACKRLSALCWTGDVESGNPGNADMVSSDGMSARKIFVYLFPPSDIISHNPIKSSPFEKEVFPNIHLSHQKQFSTWFRRKSLEWRISSPSRTMFAWYALPEWIRNFMTIVEETDVFPGNWWWNGHWVDVYTSACCQW